MVVAGALAAGAYTFSVRVTSNAFNNDPRIGVAPYAVEVTTEAVPLVVVQPFAKAKQNQDSQIVVTGTGISASR